MERVLQIYCNVFQQDYKKTRRKILRYIDKHNLIPKAIVIVYFITRIIYKQYVGL